MLTMNTCFSGKSNKGHGVSSGCTQIKIQIRSDQSLSCVLCHHEQDFLVRNWGWQLKIYWELHLTLNMSLWNLVFPLSDQSECVSTLSDF